jgi:hypothetical protein
MAVKAAELMGGLVRQVRRVAMLRERHAGQHGRRGLNIGPVLLAMDTALDGAERAAESGDIARIVDAGQRLEAISE